MFNYRYSHGGTDRMTRLVHFASEVIHKRARRQHELVEIFLDSFDVVLETASCIDAIHRQLNNARYVQIFVRIQRWLCRLVIVIIACELQTRHDWSNVQVVFFAHGVLIRMRNANVHFHRFIIAATLFTVATFRCCARRAATRTRR